MDGVVQVVLGNLLVIVPAGLVAIALICYWVLASRKDGVRSSSDVEQRFRNVFSLMTDERRQSLIQFYTQKHKCSRHEAMQIAIDARAMDENRW